MADLDRESDNQTDLAVRAFEILQNIASLYVKAEPRVKRHMLEILLLNCAFDGTNLCPIWNRPFDVIAEGPVFENGRGEPISSLCNSEALQLMNLILSRDPPRFTWKEACALAGFTSRPRRPHARHNAKAFGIRKQGWRTVPELSAASGIPIQTLYDWEAAGRIPHFRRADGMRVIDPTEFDVLVYRYAGQHRPKRARQVG